MRLTTNTSPFYNDRLNYLPEMLVKMRKAIKNQDPIEISRLAEINKLKLNACMLTSYPSLIYWSGITLEVIHAVRKLRKRGIPAFFSIDAGSNVFVNTSSSHEDVVRKGILEIRGVKEVISCEPGEKAHESNKHLF